MYMGWGGGSDLFDKSRNTGFGIQDEVHLVFRKGKGMYTYLPLLVFLITAIFSDGLLPQVTPMELGTRAILLVPCTQDRTQISEPFARVS